MTLASKLLALTFTGVVALCPGTPAASVPPTIADAQLFTFEANDQRLVGRLDTPDTQPALVGGCCAGRVFGWAVLVCREAEPGG